MSDPYVPNIGPVAPANLATSTQWAGNGAPSNTLGSDGDEYINEANGAIYTKSGGTWALKV